MRPVSCVQLSREQIEEKARHLLAQMTLKQKIHQMSGDKHLLPGLVELALGYGKRPTPAGEERRLSIPPLQFTDGPRGVTVGHSSCFPVPMGRGASWDTELEERVGDAMGIEARSQGANLLGAVCINVLRHPAWGRAQETYGEDPYHLGEMGAALVRGIQRHAMACVKHFAANSIEKSRLHVDVRLNERTLQEIYLPHFKRCVDEGAACIMSAYNKVNGDYCGYNSHLLRDILKKDWGFEGFVMSDWVFGVRNGEAAARAGMDVEMPFTMHFGKKLMKLVRRGEVFETVIDEAVLRILRQKIRFAQAGDPEQYSTHAIVSPEHRALAREVARKSVVLLKNERAGDSRHHILPIDTAHVKHIALIGRLADVLNVGDKGSSMVRPPYVVTPLAGIRAAAQQDCKIRHNDGKSINRAVEIARKADIAIVVVGYTHKDEGENMLFRGGDRDILSLKPHDEALILQVADANPNTAVILMGGGPIITEAWREKVPAMLVAWYPGMEGGNGLADILFGKANPCAKLPCVFPKSESQLPFFDKHAKSIEYGYFHGYRLMERDGHEPAFPFGFGLSYTTYAYKNLQLEQEEISTDGTLRLSVDVTNTGPVAGEEIAQLYISYECSQVERAPKELKGFSKVHLAPGETKRVQFVVAAGQLAYYDEQHSGWVVEPMDYTAYVGSSSRKEDLLSAKFRIHDRCRDQRV